MDSFIRFPHTPHLAWLSSGELRQDKLLSGSEVSELLSGEVVVEEKVDGANLGLSVEDGVLLAQNRGQYLDLQHPRGQWKPLKRWLDLHRFALIDTLGPDLILFGEWCYAVHSVRYTQLPDWFLAFDVYDRSVEAFWSTERRNALCGRLGIEVVPELGRGVFTPLELEGMLGRSRLTEGPAEGLYVRREQGGQLETRAKLVAPDFVQAIEEHWSSRPLEPNQLGAPSGSEPPQRS